MSTQHATSSEVFKHQPRSQYPYDRATDAEFQRRHEKIRAFMAELNLDALLIAGGTGTWDRNWTNTRWAVNHVGCQLSNYSYVIFPRTGEPTVLAFPIVAQMPARRAREVVEDVRGSVYAEVDAVHRLRELGVTSGNVGVVELDLTTSMPWSHRTHFAEALPDVQFSVVTQDWWRKVRVVRSAEEIAFMERAAQIGDVMSLTLEREIQSGHTERDMFAVLSNSMIRAGGEIPTMILAASGSTLAPFDTFQRERPMNRILGPGDVLLTELAPRFQDGSECQTGRTYFLGRPSRTYAHMADVMLEAYHRVTDQLRPGRTNEDILAAGQVIKDAGFEWQAPLIQGAEGGSAGSLPMVAPPMETREAEPVTLLENMVVVVEIHVATKNHSAGVFMADTWVVTDAEPRCLNNYRKDVIRL